MKAGTILQHKNNDGKNIFLWWIIENRKSVRILCLIFMTSSSKVLVEIKSTYRKLKMERFLLSIQLNAFKMNRFKDNFFVFFFLLNDYKNGKKFISNIICNVLQN